MVTITAGVTCHASFDEVYYFLMEELGKQTRQPDEVIVVVSGLMDIELRSLKRLFPYPAFYQQGNRNDWGHYKRQFITKRSKSDYTCFMNADDSYDRTFIEEMTSNAAADIVGCDFISKNTGKNAVVTKPDIGKITSGSFIFNTEFGREVGYNHNTYDADGKFVCEMIEAGATWHRLPKNLYTHR